MPDSTNHIDQLIQRYLAQELEPEEMEAFLDLVQAGTIQAQLETAMDQDASRLPFGPTVSAADQQRIFEALKLRLQIVEESNPRVAHRVHFLRTAWFRYAAAILIILTGFSIYLLLHQKTSIEVVRIVPSSVLPDVLPGSDKAVLTLGDGQRVELGVDANVLLAEKGIINDSGSVSYTGRNISGAINTLVTPKGGRYQLTLDDGTKVWLNAASSITYPTVFNGNERVVSVIGEAYFEVTKDRLRPFRVNTPEDTIIVLGTSFNVNAYNDEKTVTTTLVDGVISINRNLIKPGEAYSNRRIAKVDVAQAIAWKNGLFNFEKASFASVMRQLARWYNIDVEYADGVPPLTLGGEMGRDLNLSDVLEFFKESGVNFTMTGGNKLIVHQKLNK